MVEKSNHAPSRIPSRESVAPEAGAPAKPKRTVPATALLLGLYSAVYLFPLLWVEEFRHALAALGFGVLVAGAGILVAVRRPARHGGTRNPSRVELMWVGITSAFEMIAVAVGILSGMVLGQWWLLGALVSTAVAIHFGALTRAFRRPLDFALLPVAGAATMIAWLSPLDSLAQNWALAGALMSACCLSYAVFLIRAARGA